MSLYSTITGKAFKKLFSNKKFYKITNEKECHHNFQYKDGLNEDTILFNPSGKCNSGGLYFTELNKIGLWIDYGKNIREIEVLDDSLIYIENDKFKTNKFILQNKVLLEDFQYWNNYDFCKSVVKQNYKTLKYIKQKFQTEELCRLAINQSAYALQYIKPESQTEKLCKYAVEQSGFVLQYVKPEYQSKELCEIAIKENGCAIEFVKPELQTEELCKLAVEQNSHALLFINPNLQTKEICKIAVRQNSQMFHYVKPELMTKELSELANNSYLTSKAIYTRY
jgi:hypothetical protein